MGRRFSKGACSWKNPPQESDGKNKMKYRCEQCDFNWVGTLNTFDEVHEHEKTHLENNKIKTLGMKVK